MCSSLSLLLFFFFLLNLLTVVCLFALIYLFIPKKLKSETLVGELIAKFTKLPGSLHCLFLHEEVGFKFSKTRIFFLRLIFNFWDNVNFNIKI